MKRDEHEHPGKSFEAEIGAIFKLLGYETQRNIEIDYQRAYGRSAPNIVGIWLMTDPFYALTRSTY